MKEVLKYANCFVCGDENHHGLKARFFYDGEKATTEVTASPEFEGYRGYIMAVSFRRFWMK